MLIVWMMAPSLPVADSLILGSVIVGMNLIQTNFALF